MPARKRSSLSTTSKHAKRKRLARSQETTEERESRLNRMRDRAAEARARESSADRELRLSADRQRHSLSRSSETFTKRDIRLTADRERHVLSRESETYPQYQDRLTADRERHALSRESETYTQYQDRLTADRERHALSREYETYTQYPDRLTADRERHALSRESETYTQYQDRLTADRERHALSREYETYTQYPDRLTADRELHALSREYETYTQYQDRLTADRAHHALSRSLESDKNHLRRRRPTSARTESRAEAKTNEGFRKLSPSGLNIELEKFKRWLIRAVARMLLHEKRDEDEVWADLKKETGCDCKELWSRMHALTIKKLDHLLKVQDRVDLLPKAARMSITDWLMFDTVLVHEDFDVIGMSETAMEDKKILVDLYDLVEQYRIEFLAGDELTEGWLKLTSQYNYEDRQCSPMLLQRRWYQLKLATRARFYKFWSMYKGIAKRQHLGDPFKPTALQAKIALRYKPLVVKPFMMWEDLVKNKLVILAEEFKRKGNITLPSSVETDPDVICLEPVVETIELDDESELVLENRKQTDDEASIAIKQEPNETDHLDIVENTPCLNRQEKILHFAEAAMEATAMELDEIELADDIDGFLSPHPRVETDIPRNDHKIKNSNRDFTFTKDDTVFPLISEEESAPVVIEDPCNVNSVNVDEVQSNLEIKNEIVTRSDSQTFLEEITMAEDVDPENKDIEIKEEPETVLPQITSVFGGIDVSLLTTEMSKSANKTILENNYPPQIEISNFTPPRMDCSEEQILLNNVIKDTGKDSNLDGVKVHDSKVNCEADINADKNKNAWFGDLSNDIDFADDGIQLVDDGIAYRDDESSYEMPEIKPELDIEVHESPLERLKEDEPKVDEKLLMVPVVTMVKLDDMGIMPIPLLSHIDSKPLIDVISFKSDSIMNKIKPSKPIKNVIKTSCPIKNDPDECSPGDIVGDVKRVKVSSALLQKPRCRTYNPIQLCKNPDFNTRLKKLNVGFFSSARNRLLLKACKPLSVDVSKAFEHKLFNGTMYLEMNDIEELHKDREPENSQNVSVVPSAMVVQSLIDNTKGDIPPAPYRPSMLKSVESGHVTCERNKIINLPDISEIRRINQKLLTAEVTPLQAKYDNIQVPKSVVNSTNMDSNSSPSVSTRCRKAIAGPASRIKSMNSENYSKDVSLTKSVGGNKDTLKALNRNRIIPWKPRHKPEVPWFISKNTIYAEDTLLAIDSLNKMLYHISEGVGPLPTSKCNKGKKKGASHKEISSKQTLNDDDNNDVQVVSETKLDNEETKKCRMSKTRVNSANKQKLVYCCWARERICQLIFSKRLITKHNCPFPLCLCCCRAALVEFIKKKNVVSKSEEQNSDVLPVGVVVTNSNDIGTEDTTGAQQNKDDLNPDACVVVTEMIPEKEKSSEISTCNALPCEDVQVTEVNTIDNAMNVDSAVCCDDSTQEVATLITQETSKDVNIGAEISITTSESSPLQSNDNVVTIDLETATITNTIENPLVPIKPLIRVRSRVRPRKTKEAIIRKKITQEESHQVRQTQSLVSKENMEMVEQRVVDDLSKPSRVRNVSPDIPTNLFIDPRLPNILPKTYVNQKLMYLNSKQISKLPSDNPIFLGKNKILLTTAVFPSNFKAFQAFQANIEQTLAVPKGIKLILLPSGRLTYTWDRQIDISDDLISTLPQLIAEIQQQINGPVIQPVESNLPTDVINLSDDETPQITEYAENKSEVELSTDIVDQTKTVDNSATENTVEDSRSDGPTVKLGEINKADNTAPITTQSDASELASIEKQDGKFKNILSDLMAMSGIEPTDMTYRPIESRPTVENLKKLRTDNTEALPVQSIDSEKLPGEPIPQPINPPLLQPINATLEQNSSVQVVHSSAVNYAGSKTAASKNKILTTSLTPITSLSELKYACVQNGAFLKLDLDTGLLVPINVCMKAFADSYERTQHYLQKCSKVAPKNEIKPKRVIDLTVDDESEVPVLTLVQIIPNMVSNQLVQCPNKNTDGEILNNSNVDKDRISSGSGGKSNVVSLATKKVGIKKICPDQQPTLKVRRSNNVSKDAKVKPLKLFKSSGRPTILQRKLMEKQKKITDAKLSQEIIRLKLKRKQELQKTIRMDHTGTLGKRTSTDDSSDDEPLSEIATKIRAAERATLDDEEGIDLTALAKKSISPSSSSQLLSRLNMEVDNTDDIPDTIELVDEEPDEDMQMEEDEDMQIECLDETVFNEDESDEDCILGV